MKYSLIAILSSVCFSVMGAGLVNGTLSPVGAGNSTNFSGSQLTILTNIINSIAPTNSGITAAQAATQINDTNVNRIQPVVDAKLTITNNYVKTNAGFSAKQTLITPTNINPVFSGIATNPGSFTFKSLNGDFTIDTGGNVLTLGDTIAVGTLPTEVGVTSDLLIKNGDGFIGTLSRTRAGVVTNDNNGNIGYSSAPLISLAGATAGTLPRASVDTSWMPFTNSVAYSNATGLPVIGNGLVIVGTNTYGAILVVPTNWPSGGGTVPSGLVTNNADFPITVTHLGNSTTIYASSPPSLETGIGTFHSYVVVSNTGVATVLTSTTGEDGNAKLILSGNTNEVASQSTFEATNFLGRSFQGGTFNGNGFIITNTGYGLLTNSVVTLIQGDSLSSTPPGGGASHGWPYYWTNLFQTGSNWRFGTNGAVAGKTTATITTEMPSFLAPWGNSGSTNKLFFLLSSVNDIRAHADPLVIASNYNYCLYLAKQSNCITVAFTIQGAFDMVEADDAALQAYNSYITAGTNYDYIVPLNMCMPPPLDSGMYSDNVHPNDAGHTRIAFLVDQTLRRARKNLLFPFAYTPSKSVRGSGTSPVSLGNWVGQGQYSGIAFYWTGTDIAQILKYPGYVDFDYNPSGNSLTPELFTKMRLTATNTSFPIGIASITNVATASTSITFPATTVKWTNTAPINIVVYIDNTGVTGTTFLKNGQQIFSGIVNDMTIPMKPGDYFSETYTVGTPTARWEPQ